MPFMLANSSSAERIFASGSLLVGWKDWSMLFGVKILAGEFGLGDVPGAAFPSKASSLYVMPFTCSTSPPSIVPNCKIFPSAGERTALGFGSRGRTPGFNVL